MKQNRQLCITRVYIVVTVVIILILSRLRNVGGSIRVPSPAWNNARKGTLGRSSSTSKAGMSPYKFNSVVGRKLQPQKSIHSWNSVSYINQ